MDPALFLVACIALATSLVVAVRAHRWHRKMRIENDELKTAGEELCQIIAWQHQAIYRLGCQMYGRAATERAMREARERGEN